MTCLCKIFQLFLSHRLEHFARRADEIVRPGFTTLGRQRRACGFLLGFGLCGHDRLLCDAKETCEARAGSGAGNHSVFENVVRVVQFRRRVMRGILLWLIGIPIPVIILLYLFGAVGG